ncbi:MAG: putative Na+/H+ antiporter [Opitutaceae bacterium]
MEPFNLVATLIFLLAITHTFLTGKIQHWAHVVQERHARTRRDRTPQLEMNEDSPPYEVSFMGQALHFFGEIEAVFGLWALVLAGALVGFKGSDTAIHYIAHQVNYTEAMFVVIVMAIAATRPVLTLAERALYGVASLGRGKPVAWWWSILILAPLLGSFITEPAAMTIAALMLAQQFYEFKPSTRLKYATLALLFVNISVGGTLTHFAAPPVLMVASAWKWGTGFMLTHFGWKAALGIVVATGFTFLCFRSELLALKPSAEAQKKSPVVASIPLWVTLAHIIFLGFVVWMAHYPVLFVGAFLFFVGFMQATAHHQTKLDMRAPILVGFFLAGLVVHGGLQGWWIEPVLKSLTEVPVFFGATILTAFNDNAAITYLATLVPGFTDGMKYAVVAGAVTGGGLTVIANAPNPAGQTILKRYFPEGVAPLHLFIWALPPTIIMGLSLMLF